MEKPLNKYTYNMLKYFLLLLFSICSISIYSQNSEIDYSTPKDYEIGGITIKGTQHLNDNALITISGLTVGENIKIPGENISKAINKLWKQRGIHGKIGKNTTMTTI